MKNKKTIAILYALLAATLYSLNTPLSKMLLNYVSSRYMAAFLYLGAGFGVGIMYLFRYKEENPEEKLSKSDLPYTIGMVILDILAPILMMMGLKITNSSSASLLGNFEIVATTLIAFFIFKEKISKKICLAIILVTISSVILTFDIASSYQLSKGSIYIILATICWGLENNCTRSISHKSSYEIVTIKGIFSGLGAYVIAYLSKDEFPPIKYILLIMLLGFISYGLSIFTYVRAQNTLGATRTSAYYQVSPFVGSFLAFLINKDKLGVNYIIALPIMILGSIITTSDILKNEDNI